MVLKYFLIMSTCISPLFAERMSMNIKKVIIPAAGLGTRFFPWSKSMPKELLPLGDSPAIEHVVRESIDSGCDSIIMIAGARKHPIMDYFEKANLAASFSYVPQPEPKGLGHAVSMAEHLINDEYVGIILPDELLFCDETPGLKQLIDVAKKENATVVAVREVSWDKVSALGVVAVKQKLSDRLFDVSALVEKPKREDAPSNLALIGRYVLSPKIFKSLQTIEPGAKGEYQLTDAIADLLKRGERVLAYKIDGIRHDIGNPLGWAKAVIVSSLDSKRYGNEIKRFIEDEFTRRMKNEELFVRKSEKEICI